MMWTGINWFRWQGATGIIAFALGERTSKDVFVHSSYHLNSCSFSTVILQLRLYALYFLDKRVLAFMICTFLACLAASATLISIGLSHVKGPPPVSFLQITAIMNLTRPPSSLGPCTPRTTVLRAHQYPHELLSLVDTNSYLWNGSLRPRTLQRAPKLF